MEIAGGSILLDHGWHYLYLVLSIIRDVPLSASTKMQYLGGSHLEEAKGSRKNNFTFSHLSFSPSLAYRSQQEDFRFINVDSIPQYV